MDLIEVLTSLKLGHVANIRGTRIIARKPRVYDNANTPGCSECIFQKEGGAVDCTLKNTCMAHKRPDGKSVIFKIFNNVKK